MPGPVSNKGSSPVPRQAPANQLMSPTAKALSGLFLRLVLRLKGIIATWRYDSSDYIISLNPSRHVYKSLSRAGRGFEGPIFTNSPAQCGVEPRDIHKTHFTPGYSERVKRPQRRLGTVPFDYFREGKFSPVLPIELSRALRPRYSKPRTDQETQPQPFQHSVLPVQISLAGYKEQSPVATGADI